MREPRARTLVLALAAAGLFVFAGTGGAEPPALAPELDIQGHRGCRGLMPENTLPAFAKALELGVTTLELDIQATRDRVLVVYHDQRLDAKRCMHDDGRKVSKKPFKDLLYEQLNDIDCGSRPHAGFLEQQRVPGARIPRLDEVLTLARDADYPVRLSIEIKLQKPGHALPVRDIAELLVGAVREHGLSDRTIVQSFAPSALAAVRDLDPTLARAILVRNRGRYASVVEESGATILSPKYTGLQEGDVRHFQSRGIPVIPWTVNQVADIRRMLDWGVEGIISDYPDRVIELRSAAAARP
jgi:glycerophosphoryl diester phosphodiesterase